MPTSFDRVSVEQPLFLRDDLAYPVDVSTDVGAPKSEPSLPLRPGVVCLQRWLDLNA